LRSGLFKQNTVARYKSKYLPTKKCWVGYAAAYDQNHTSHSTSSTLLFLSRRRRLVCKRCACL